MANRPTNPNGRGIENDSSSEKELRTPKKNSLIKLVANPSNNKNQSKSTRTNKVSGVRNASKVKDFLFITVILSCFAISFLSKENAQASLLGVNTNFVKPMENLPMACLMNLTVENYDNYICIEDMPKIVMEPMETTLTMDKVSSLSTPILPTKYTPSSYYHDNTDYISISTPVNTETYQAKQKEQHTYTIKVTTINKVINTVEQTIESTSKQDEKPVKVVDVNKSARPNEAAYKAISTNELAAIQKEAAKSSKMILLKFGAKWCAPCKIMEEGTFQNHKVKDYLNANYLVLNVDVDSIDGMSLKQKYNVKMLPTMIIFDANSKEVVRFEESLSSRKMLSHLETYNQPEYNTMATVKNETIKTDKINHIIDNIVQEYVMND